MTQNNFIFDVCLSCINCLKSHDPDKPVSCKIHDKNYIYDEGRIHCHEYSKFYGGDKNE